MSNAKFFNPKSVVITSVDGTQFTMTATVGAFSYYEDIFTPFVSANMVVVDSGQNLIGNLPIQGGEKINFTLDNVCLLYTSPSPRDGLLSRMPSSA